MKRIFIVLFVLIILLFGIVMLRRSPTDVDKTKKISEAIPTPIATAQPTLAESSTALYSIEVEKPNWKVGETAVASIYFISEGVKIYGGDVIVRFDPQFLEADPNLAFGDFFASYPRRDIDNTAGAIKVTGIGAKTKEAVSGKNLFMSVNFRAKKTGETTLEIDFLPGRTNLSNLVERETSRNILGSVKNVKLIIGS